MGGPEIAIEWERGSGPQIPTRRVVWFCFYQNNHPSQIILRDDAHSRKCVLISVPTCCFQRFMYNFVINIVCWKSKYFKSRESYMCALCINKKRVMWVFMDFPGGSVVKNLPANVGDAGSIPGAGRFLRVGNGNSLQYSCLRNPMDKGTWQATVHGAAKGQTHWATEHTWVSYCSIWLWLQRNTLNHTKVRKHLETFYSWYSFSHWNVLRVISWKWQ